MTFRLEGRKRVIKAEPKFATEWGVRGEVCHFKEVLKSLDECYVRDYRCVSPMMAIFEISSELKSFQKIRNK